jgi:hypothetical protein
MMLVPRCRPWLADVHRGVAAYDAHRVDAVDVAGGEGVVVRSVPELTAAAARLDMACRGRSLRGGT